MYTRVLILLLFVATGAALADRERKTVPFLCNDLFRILNHDQISELAHEDRGRRHDEIMRILGPEKLLIIEKALGLPAFQVIQTEQEALAIFDRVVQDSTAHKPISGILKGLPDPQAWALYLLTGFYAGSTHSNGHREIIDEVADRLPLSAVLGGNSPRYLDIGIGDGNMSAAGLAKNPRALQMGVDVAGGSLGRTMAVLNALVDRLQAKHAGPKMFDYGRFGLIRGSASDPTLLGGQRFDAVTMILTLFAVPEMQRKLALRNAADHTEPGGTVTLVEPTPSAASGGHDFIRQVVIDAYHNNQELNVLDVGILVAMNMHGLLNIKFMTPEEQAAMGREVGLVPKGKPKTVYYGIANLGSFEKIIPKKKVFAADPFPWAHVPHNSPALSLLKQRVQDEFNRHAPESITVDTATDRDGAEIRNFIREERAKLGVAVDEKLEPELKEIEASFEKKGGYFLVLRDRQNKIIGTFAFQPKGKRSAELKKMYLNERFKSQGAGEQVLDAMVRGAALQGYAELYAETTPQLQSAKMFERAGFLPSTRPNGAPDLEVSQSMWFRKTLPQPRR